MVNERKKIQMLVIMKLIRKYLEKINLDRYNENKEMMLERRKKTLSR